MATGRKRLRVRLFLGVEFDSSEAKAAFCDRLECLHTLLTGPEQRTLDNHGDLCALFDQAEKSMTPIFPGCFTGSCG